jgi:hypothetical protein
MHKFIVETVQLRCWLYRGTKAFCLLDNNYVEFKPDNEKELASICRLCGKEAQAKSGNKSKSFSPMK